MVHKYGTIFQMHSSRVCTPSARRWVDSSRSVKKPSLVTSKLLLADPSQADSMKVKKLLAFYEVRRFIIIFIRGRVRK
jgi:hypothetical protein